MTLKHLHRGEKKVHFSTKQHMTGQVSPAKDPTAEKILEEKKPMRKKKSRCVSCVQKTALMTMLVALLCLVAIPKKSGHRSIGMRKLSRAAEGAAEATAEVEKSGHRSIGMRKLSRAAEATVEVASETSASMRGSLSSVDVKAVEDFVSETATETISVVVKTVEDLVSETTTETTHEDEGDEEEDTHEEQNTTEESPEESELPNLHLVASPVVSPRTLPDKLFAKLKKKKKKTHTPPTEVEVQFCRDNVFAAIGSFAQEQVRPREVKRSCTDSERTHRFDICDDLVDFTGMSLEDVELRMGMVDNFHHEAEYSFWNPETASQLAWFYSTSQAYLFRNAVRGAKSHALDALIKDVHEPVLDYAGGAGNSLLYLAVNRTMKCQYFDIGMIERAFVQFRVAKRGLQNLVSFVDPWSQRTVWQFDPIKALPRDGSLGAILANDVLSRVPHYENVVSAMIDSLKMGGVIVEDSKFATHPAYLARMHIDNGGLSMEEAMGDRMVYKAEEGHWEKVKD